MKTILKFRILHDGWEFDNEGWVIEDEAGGRRAMTTTMGQDWPMTNGELEAKIAETRASLAGLESALALISK